MVVDPGGSTATADVLLQDCKIANPFQSGNSFSCSDWGIKDKGVIEIYDLSGRMIAAQTIDNQNDIKIKSNLNAGFYTFILRDARGTVWRKKVIVE